jgi:hypothetical protein
MNFFFLCCCCIFESGSPSTVKLLTADQDIDCNYHCVVFFLDSWQLSCESVADRFQFA